MYFQYKDDVRMYCGNLSLMHLVGDLNKVFAQIIYHNFSFHSKNV